MVEGAIFRSYLGDGWGRLHPDIQKRFYTDPPKGKSLRYTGTMEHIDASLPGRIMAHAFYTFCNALCPWVQKNVPADIRVYKRPDGISVHKSRSYFFSGGKTYAFNSWMTLVGTDEILEYVNSWLGLRLFIEEERGDLHFFSEQCFIEIWGRRLVIPTWLGVGRVDLWHRNSGPEAFTIEIVIKHPLFGRIFYQHGSFTHAEPVA